MTLLFSGLIISVLLLILALSKLFVDLFCRLIAIQLLSLNSNLLFKFGDNILEFLLYILTVELLLLLSIFFKTNFKFY